MYLTLLDCVVFAERVGIVPFTHLLNVFEVFVMAGQQLLTIMLPVAFTVPHPPFRGML